MHDINAIRDDPDAFDAALARRGLEPQSRAIVLIDEARRGLVRRVQETQNRRNEASKAIGKMLRTGDCANAEALKADIAKDKESLAEMEAEARRRDKRVSDALAGLPNLPLPEVPGGVDESANLEVSRWGTPRQFDFAPKEHADLGPPLGLDFETGAAISGARFTFLRGDMARLHRALGQFMLDHQTSEPEKRGYTECAPPLLVRDEAVFGTGQLPKFADDLFRTSLDDVSKQILDTISEKSFDAKSERVLSMFARFADRQARRWLIPTAEVSLTNAVREKILAEAELPIRMAALTPCFRSEAGAAGKDTRGFIRQHQFDKVELVTICRPEDTAAEHERMTAAAESVLEALELPYRKMLLCAGDMGFTAQKTYDLEVWLPGQGAYREISSISQCGDFQARRMNARFKRAGQKGTEFVHTLNGSGVAVGRALVAVLESYQREDGSVEVPAALHGYMGGITKLIPGG